VLQLAGWATLARPEGGSSLPAFAQARDGASVSAAIDLDGAWRLRATDETGWIDAVVPGVVQSDLLRAGRIQDPYYRDYELDAQWVERKGWEYRRSFDVPPPFLRHDRICLDCRGLDTFAEIFLNGRILARSENRHLRQELDVRPRLRAGRNEIRILLRPARLGRDWGLRLRTSGIWRPIRLAAYDTARIDDVLVREDLTHPSRAVLVVSSAIERYRAGPLELEIAVTLDGRALATSSSVLFGDRSTQALTIENPRRWWPCGWGEQHLYEVTAVLKARGRAVNQLTQRIGLRTITIVRGREAGGEGFGIAVNGKLLFAKGGSWIPADSLPNRLTEGDYRRLLQACVDAHMNMVRVRGGGLYEADAFYEFCDENGLLVWQDFMLAVDPYLAAPSYVESVRREVRDVVRRLRHHASIALWCGDDGAESHGGPTWSGKHPPATRMKRDRILHETIPKTVRLFDPDRPYLPSSPGHPLAREPFSEFDRLGRYPFVTEFGCPSLPDLATIHEMAAPADRYYPSHVLEHHEDRGEEGANERETARTARRLAAELGTPSSLEDWVYLSQVLQAEAVRRGVEALRRNHPRSTGALYWQLDDGWPALSSSSIDYRGRLKLLHHAARRFFSPILVSAVGEPSPDPADLGQTGRVEIWGTSDLLRETKARLQWSLLCLDGDELRRGEQDVVLPPNRAALIARMDLRKEVGEDPWRRTGRKVSYEVRRRHVLCCRLMQDGRELSSNVAFFVPLKYLALVPPGLRWSVGTDGRRPAIGLVAKRFAAFVHLGLSEGSARFSDNGFHLLPGDARRIEVLSSDALPEQLAERLRVRSLIDTRR
jgi:beta-mannosidase